MKNINIEIPAGHEIDLEKSNLAEGKIVFKETKNPLPKIWKELKNVSGFYIAPSSIVIRASNLEPEHAHKNIFASIEEAEAAIALAQLSQLRKVYRQGWVPDWAVDDEKFCIRFFDGDTRCDYFSNTSHYLSFQSEEVRDEFLRNFFDLIERAKPLMS